MKQIFNCAKLLFIMLALSLKLDASNKIHNQSNNVSIEEEEEEETIRACCSDSSRYTYSYDTYENEPFYDEYNENAHPLEED